MDEKRLKEANSLQEDIKNIEKVLAAHKGRKWIRAVFEKKKTIGIICPFYEELFYSVRFQNELAEWLEQKREQYQREFNSI